MLCPQLDVPAASVAYRDCAFDEACEMLSLRLKSVQGGSVTVLLNGRELGSWSGDTRTCEHRSSPPMDRYAHREIVARARERQPIWEDIDFPLPDDVREGTLEIRMTGDIRLSFLRAKAGPGERKIRTGVAN